MTKTARIYGGSLYDLAVEESLADELLAELEGVRAILKENPLYIRLLAEPSVAKTERLSLIEKAFGGQVHAYILHFLKILCENGILQEFGGCCREFKRRYNEDHGIAEAVVISAVPLSESQSAALKEKLERLSRRQIILTQKTDSRVIGGLRVELEGTQYDGTLEGRLSTLRRDITEIIV